MEIWKEVEGYEGLYEVSNTGKVRSMNYRKTGKVKELKSLNNSTGYLQVNLYKDGKRTSHLVHRLVAKAFLDDWGLWFSDINHIDEDKTNNNVWNLEWCSRRYNNNFGSRNERMVQTKIKNGTFNQDMCGRFDTSDMKEYKKEYNKEYYEAHKEKMREYQRQHYRLKNKKKV